MLSSSSNTRTYHGGSPIEETLCAVYEPSEVLADDVENVAFISLAQAKKRPGRDRRAAAEDTVRSTKSPWQAEHDGSHCARLSDIAPDLLDA